MLKFQQEFSVRNYFKLTFFSSFSILVFVSAILGFYINYSLLFFNYYLKRKILKLISFSVLYSVLTAFFCGILMSLIFGGRTLFNEEFRSFLGILLVLFVIAQFHGTIALVIRGFITGYSDILLKEELGRKNLNTELALIKSQINPHFLFNTISNIDVLIQKNPPLASEYLNKLSEMLRFSLYEAEGISIPLHKELEYIEKYIDLQKIRTSNPEYVKYFVQGNPSGKVIAPMLFIPYIENAFKHSEKIKSNGNIIVTFDITDEVISFECSNTMEEESLMKDSTGGKGNELTQKRIVLLYPNKHNLAIIKEQFKYTVKLKIILHDH